MSTPSRATAASLAVGLVLAACAPPPLPPCPEPSPMPALGLSATFDYSLFGEDIRFDAGFVTTPEGTRCWFSTSKSFCSNTEKMTIPADGAWGAAESEKLANILAMHFKKQWLVDSCTGKLLVEAFVAAADEHDGAAALQLQAVMGGLQRFLDGRRWFSDPVFVKAFTVRGDKTLAPHEVELRVGYGTKDGLEEGVAVTRALTPVEADYLRYLAPLPPLTMQGFHFPILTFDVHADSQSFPPPDGQRFPDNGPCSSDGSHQMGKNPFEIITEKPCLAARDDPYFGRGQLLLKLADAVCKSALEVPSRVPGAQCTLGLNENAHHGFAEQNFEKQYDQLRRDGGPGPLAPVPPRSGDPAEVPLAPSVP